MWMPILPIFGGRSLIGGVLQHNQGKAEVGPQAKPANSVENDLKLTR